MQNWKIVDENYLNYLREIEGKIPYSNYGQHKFKPFFGELFKIGELIYLTQVSHPKERHNKMKNEKDFIKLLHPKDNSLMAVINLNYMFPVHNILVKDLKYKDISNNRNFNSSKEKSKYIDILKMELLTINKFDLKSMAENLYDIKYKQPNSHISKRCIDFKRLEFYALSYINNELYQEVALSEEPIGN